MANKVKETKVDKQIITFEISNDLREKLRLEAFKEDVSISALIRDLITQGLENKIRKD